MQIKIMDEGLNEILCFVLYRIPEFVLVFSVYKICYVSFVVDLKDFKFLHRNLNS